MIGNWDWTRSLKMNTNELQYPVWTASVQIPVTILGHDQLEYKYIVVLSNGLSESLIRWEQLESSTINRSLFLLKKPLNLTVQDEEGKSSPIFIKEYEKFVYKMDAESDEDPMAMIDQSESLNPHSLRQFEKLIITKERFQNDSESRSEDSGSAFSSFINHNYSIGKSSLNYEQMCKKMNVPELYNQFVEEKKKQDIIQNVQNDGYDSDEEGTCSPEKRMIEDYSDEDILSQSQTEEKKGSMEQLKIEKKADEQDDYEKIQIDSEDFLIMASIKLPIIGYKDEITGKWKVKEAPSLLYPTLYRFRENNFVKLTWIGWAGINEDELTDEDKEEIRQLYLDHDCIPIFISQDLLDRYMYYFETIIYPLFHSFKGLNDSNDDLANVDYWNAFKELNIIMAQEILKAKINPKDMIWVNDLHFLLVPYYIRDKDPHANIGLFIHAAFPNSQIMQIFPQRSEILRSMLCSDLIGFHLFEYAKNFMTACRKLLETNYEFRRGGCLILNYNGRNTTLRIGHVGIEKQYIDQVLKSEEFTKCYGSLLSPYMQKKILISSVDYMHPISGIENKLRAIYNFLLSNPKKAKQIMLVQYLVPLRMAGKDVQNHEMFQKSREQIFELASLINTTFGNVVFLKQEGASKAQRCALWARSNLFLNTNLKDGLCLQPLEFLAVKSFLNKTDDSAMIVSEFTGVSQAISGIHKVNPQNINQIKQKIEKALSMCCQEKRERFESAAHYLSKHSTLKWAHSFLLDLKRAHQPVTKTLSFDIEIQTPLTYYMGVNYHIYNRFMIYSNESVITDNLMSKIMKTYSQSTNRLIIVDHEGTLPRKIYADPEPSTQVLSILDQLTRDKRNTVFVVSPHNKKAVHQWFSSISMLGLAAEDGYLYRYNSQFKSEYEWQKLIEIDHTHMEWMQHVEDLMNHYVDKTDGAFMERKESTIVFDFTDADSQFATMIAQELGKHLDILKSNGYPIQKVFGHSYIEVKPMELKKTLLLEKILKSKTVKTKIDFILYIGEDSSNEEVFQLLNKQSLANYTINTSKKECNIYPCTVGKKPTNASYYFIDNQDMCTLLRNLSNESVKIKKNRSAADMIQERQEKEESQHQRTGSRDHLTKSFRVIKSKQPLQAVKIKSQDQQESAFKNKKK